MTEVAVKVQDQGIISYTRGVIRLVDRAALGANHDPTHPG